MSSRSGDRRKGNANAMHPVWRRAGVAVGAVLLAAGVQFWARAPRVAGHSAVAAADPVASWAYRFLPGSALYPIYTNIAVTLSAPGTEFGPGQAVLLSGSVSADGGLAPLGGQGVELTIAEPDGSSIQTTVVTDKFGDFSYQVQLDGTAPAGTYVASVTALPDLGLAVTTATVSFAVVAGAPSAPAPQPPTSSAGPAGVPAPSGPAVWTAPLRMQNGYLTLPCTIDGVGFGACRLDTASGLSVIVAPGMVSGVPDQEAFTVASVSGSSAAYAGLGTISVTAAYSTPAPVAFSGYVTVDGSDNLAQPDLGLPTIRALCAGSIEIDQSDQTLACY